jgi:hypothetical protein
LAHGFEAAQALDDGSVSGVMRPKPLRFRVEAGTDVGDRVLDLAPAFGVPAGLTLPVHAILVADDEVLDVRRHAARVGIDLKLGLGQRPSSRAGGD